MFEDYKIVFCQQCTHSVFPVETAPWGTCCKEMKTICSRYPRSCNKFERKENRNGENK